MIKGKITNTRSEAGIASIEVTFYDGDTEVSKDYFSVADAPGAKPALLEMIRNKIAELETPVVKKEVVKDTSVKHLGVAVDLEITSDAVKEVV